jgi:hypothetical protein
VQAVFVAAVRFGDGRLHGNVLGLAVGNHLRAAGKAVAEPLHAPRRDDRDVRLERLGRQLKTALVVAFAGGPVGERVRAGFASHLQALLGYQRPGDRGAQKIDPFVLGLRLQDRERKVAAQFLLGVDNPGAGGPDVPGLLQDRFAVLTRLAHIHVHRVDFVALVHEPSQDDGCVQTTGIGQDALWHDFIIPLLEVECPSEVPL